MKIENKEPMMPNSDNTPLNPFLQDGYHMGIKLGTNLTVMFANHDTVECKYLILINTITGERIKIIP